MSTLAFFCPCVPPTTTHQAKRIARRGRFVRLIDKPELQQARHDLEALLVAHRPDQPLMGPVRLELSFTWPWLKGHSAKVRAQGLVRKVTKPDCSNLAKTLEDRLTFLRFLEDDAQVAVLEVQKWHGDQPGIAVRLTALTGDAPSVPVPQFAHDRPALGDSSWSPHRLLVTPAPPESAAPDTRARSHTLPPGRRPERPSEPSLASAPARPAGAGRPCVKT